MTAFIPIALFILLLAGACLCVTHGTDPEEDEPLFVGGTEEPRSEP